MSLESPKPVFVPTNPQNKNIEKFRQEINRKRNLNLKDYKDLHEYSVNPSTTLDFWQDVWNYVGIKASKVSSVVMRPEDVGRGLFPPPRFFPEARLNFAENMFEYGDPNKAALIGAREGGAEHEEVTYGELREQVRQLASAMRKVGIQKGDRVAAIISNSIVSFVICLATLSIGAIFSSSACDMGAAGINDRLEQIRPKLIFADNAALYNGKIISQMDKLQTIVKTLHSELLLHVIVIPRIASQPRTLEGFEKSLTWNDFQVKSTDDALNFEQVEFNHPAVIVYSSGTTGKPKCILHSHGGYLIQMKKEHMFHGDLRPEDTTFQYSSTGWIMYNHQYGGLAVGATVVLYDGSPFYPQKDTLIKFVASQKATTWGTSPKYLAELQANNIIPRDVGDLSNLRLVSSTGSVLTSAQTLWFYQTWPPNVPLSSISGGTDVMCCFVGSVPSWPLYAGEVQYKSLGMAVQVYSQSGSNDIEKSGHPGELVCVMPFPSMPVALWGDKTGETYRKAYFDKFPGVWHHGDFLAINPTTKGVIMLGRSDGVLNPAGVRFGSAEIYAVTERFPQIQDAICIGQRRAQDLDEQVILFLKLNPDFKLTPQLTAQIKEAIKTALSARHVPKYVFEVHDIPYTVNGKKVEIAVKQIVCGNVGIQVSGTVGNPESLEEYRQFVDVERVHNERNRAAKL